MRMCRRWGCKVDCAVNGLDASWLKRTSINVPKLAQLQVKYKFCLCEKEQILPLAATLLTHSEIQSLYKV